MARSSDGPWFRKVKNTWYAWHEGKQISLKVRGGGNEEEAQKAWHRLMGGVPALKAQKPPERKPEPLPTTAEPKPVNLTLTSMVKAFLAEAKERVKPMTLKGYDGFLTPFAEAFKGTKPEALTIPQVERYSKKPTWSSSYRHGFIGTVVSLFKWAVDTGLMHRSPLQGIRKPVKQSRGRKAIISEADHLKLLQAAKGVFREFIRLLWLLGCRPGELTGLTANDVDLSNRVIILSQHKTAEQTGKDRVIVLPDEAVTVLRDLIAHRPEGLLFRRDDGGKLSPQNVTNRLQVLCKRAGVKAMAYGYRHSFATSALASGVPDAHVAALLGHSGTTMLHKHYSHLTSKTSILREALGMVRRV